MGFVKVKITAPFALTLPVFGDLSDPASAANPFYGLVTFLNDSVPKSDRYTDDGVTYTWHAEVLPAMFSVGLLTVITSQGVDVFSLPLFFEIDLAANVPTQWKLLDETGQPIDRTWQQYFDATSTATPMTIGNKTYTSTVVNGDYLPASQSLALGVALITQPEIQAMQAAAVIPE